MELTSPVKRDAGHYRIDSGCWQEQFVWLRVKVGLALDSRPMRTRALAIVVATMAILVAGCSGDDGSDATSTAPVTTVATTEQSPPPVAPAVPPTTISSWASASNTGPWTPTVSLK